MPDFWSKIRKPIVALAPMSGVSDVAFRSIAKKWGSDITFSEFISTDALFYKPNNEKSYNLANFIAGERPFIIQLFGGNPEHFKVAVKDLNEKFHSDGFDINFGCPARSVIHNGSGSCLFMKPELAKQIIYAVKEASGGLPTSIKIRASYKQVGCMDFLRAIDGAPFENVTVHMRTYEQVHSGQPNWDVGKQVKEFYKDRGITVMVNGGIDSGIKAKEVLDYTKADGVMVAQASLGNPFIFSEIKSALAGAPLPKIDFQARIQTALEHAKLMEQYKGERGMLEIRKHLVWYFKGFPNASKMRAELSQVNSLHQLNEILANANENIQ